MIVEHDGELKMCPFRVDGADFADCYKDKCPCYQKNQQGKFIAEFCYRDNIAYKCYSVDKDSRRE